MRTALLAVGLLGCSLLGSCNIVAPVVYLVEGPPKDDAVFTLPKERPTLILVDDRVNALPRPRLRETIAAKAQELLLKQRVLTKVIDCRGAYAAMSSDREGKVQSLTEIGRAVKAEIVVCVAVDSFGAPSTGASAGQQLILESAMRVRVLDVTKDDPRLWPAMNEGYSFVARHRPAAGTNVETLTQAQAVQIALAEQCGKAISELFTKHDPATSAAKGK